MIFWLLNYSIAGTLVFANWVVSVPIGLFSPYIGKWRIWKLVEKVSGQGCFWVGVDCVQVQPTFYARSIYCTAKTYMCCPRPRRNIHREAKKRGRCEDFRHWGSWSVVMLGSGVLDRTPSQTLEPKTPNPKTLNSEPSTLCGRHAYIDDYNCHVTQRNCSL